MTDSYDRGSRKKPWQYAVASYFMPGLGTILAGRLVRGWIILLVALTAGVTMAVMSFSNRGDVALGVALGAVVLWIYGMFDAVAAAERWNTENGFESPSKRDE